MKITLDKLIDEIKDCTFYRIAFDTYDEKRVWIIGEKNSYLEKIEDPDDPNNSEYDAYLNVRQAISIRLNNDDKLLIDIEPELNYHIKEQCEEDSNHFYKFELAEYVDVIDFEKFDTSDEFFEDILKNLDSMLKDKFDMSIEDFSFGKYFNKSLFGKDSGQLEGAFYEIKIYKPDMVGIEISSIVREPLDDHAYIYFDKISSTKEPLKGATVSYSTTDLKNEILNLIKKLIVTSSCEYKNILKEGIHKGYKWLKSKIK